MQTESNQVLESSGFFIHYVGVGLVSSAMNLTALIEKYNPDRIINIGTAGSFTVPVGSVVEVQRCKQRGQVYSKLKKTITLEKVSELQSVVCGSADFIQSIPDSSFEIMDMECYALAYVCYRYNKTFHCFKYISDNSSENVEMNWKNNLKSAQMQFIKIFQILNEEG